MLVTCYVSAGLSTPCQYSSADSFRIRERHPEGNNSFFRGEMGGGEGRGSAGLLGEPSISVGCSLASPIARKPSGFENRNVPTPVTATT